MTPTTKWISRVVLALGVSLVLWAYVTVAIKAGLI